MASARKRDKLPFLARLPRRAGSRQPVGKNLDELSLHHLDGAVLEEVVVIRVDGVHHRRSETQERTVNYLLVLNHANV